MKKRYYVSIQSKAILENKEDSSYEFEIDASPEEVEQLKNIFTKMGNADHSGYWKVHVPFTQYHNDPENDAYDQQLKQAYQLIYAVGTNETKEHIDAMNIIS